MHSRLTGAKHPHGLTTAGRGEAGGPTRRRHWPRRLGRLAPGAAAALVLALAAGCASGGLPGPAAGSGGGTGAAKPAPGWQATSAQDHALGTWTHGSSFIVVANTEITAYNQLTGKVEWRTKPPAAQKYPTMFCGASRSVSGSTAVVGLGIVTGKAGDTSDCHSIVSVNVETGQLGWAQLLPSNDQFDQYAQTLDGQTSLAQNGVLIAVSGDTVVAGWLGVLAAFSLSSGQRQWSAVIGGGTDFISNVTKDIAIAGTSAYVTAAQVYPAKTEVLRVDDATGDVTGKLTLTKGNSGLASPTEATVVSTAPLVVAAQQVTPRPATSVLLLSDSLAVHGRVNGTGLFTSPAISSTAVHDFYPFAVGQGLLAAVTMPAANGNGSNALVAYDAATGARKWTAAAPAGTEYWAPVAVAGPVIQVAGISASGRGNPELVTVDAASGKLVSAGQARVLGPAALGPANAYYRYVRADGHVFGINWAIAKTGPGSVPSVFSLS